MKLLPMALIGLLIYAFGVTGCGTDPPAIGVDQPDGAEFDVGGSGEADAAPDVRDETDASTPDVGSPDTGVPDTGGPDTGDPGVIPTEGTALRGELSPAGHHAQGTSYSLHGQLSPVPAATVLEGGGYEVRVRPVISF